MSFIPNSQLSSDPVTILRCRQHAARIFADDQFRLLPKTKFLFHVSFDIDWNVVNPLPKTSVIPTLVETLKDEINLLVKSVDLPSYTVQHEVLNQYNRKRVVQFQHKYSDVGISFHDDNMGLINQMWQLYYKYYYADPTVSKKDSAYRKNATLSADYISSPYGYLGKKKSFFKDIMIFQMSRKEFVSYRLINPVITGWTGGKLGYHEAGSHSFDMRLAYEAVYYNFGFVNHINDGYEVEMNNFGLLSPLYDTTLSPIQPTDTNYDINNTTNSKSFAKILFGSTDSSPPTNIFDDTNIVAPVPTDVDQVYYESLLAVQPEIGGLQDIALPVGATSGDPEGTTVASEADVPNTSVDNTLAETPAPDYTQ